MSTVIIEVENTISGDIQVVRKENGLYDVQTTGLDGASFTIRHPDGSAENAICAIGHYLNGEAYRRIKAEASLKELKDLASIAVLDNDDKTVEEKAEALKKLILLISK